MVLADVVSGDIFCETVSLSVLSGVYCVVFEAGGVVVVEFSVSVVDVTDVLFTVAAGVV